jgi:hypothetical protein
LPSIYFKKDLENIFNKDYLIFNSFGQKIDSKHLKTGIYFLIAKEKVRVGRKVILIK